MRTREIRIRFVRSDFDHCQSTVPQSVPLLFTCDYHPVPPPSISPAPSPTPGTKEGDNCSDISDTCFTQSQCGDNGEGGCQGTGREGMQVAGNGRIPLCPSSVVACKCKKNNNKKPENQRIYIYGYLLISFTCLAVNEPSDVTNLSRFHPSQPVTRMH